MELLACFLYADSIFVGNILLPFITGQVEAT